MTAHAITSITNFLLAAEVFFLAGRMSGTPKVRFSAAWYFSGVLLLLGVAALLGGIDPVLQLAGLAGESVQIPADQGLEMTGLEVGDHAVIGGTVGGPFRRRNGVVSVLLSDGPASLCGDPATVLTLALDGKVLPGSVEGDSQIQGSVGHRLIVAQ